MATDEGPAEKRRKLSPSTYLSEAQQTSVASPDAKPKMPSTDRELLLFKNKQMSLRLREYSRDSREQLSEITELSNLSKTHKHAFQRLSSQWTRLDQDLHLLVCRFEERHSHQHAEEQFSLSSYLLDDSSLDEAAKRTQALLERVFYLLEVSLKTSSDNVANASVSADDMLRDEVSRQIVSRETLEKSLDHLQTESRLSQLEADKVKQELAAVQERESRLHSELGDLKRRLRTALRRRDADDYDEETGGGDGGDSAQPPRKTDTPSESIVSELEALRTRASQAEALAQMRLEQQEQLNHDRRELEGKLRESCARVVRQTEMVNSINNERESCLMQLESANAELLKSNNRLEQQSATVCRHQQAASASHNELTGKLREELRQMQKVLHENEGRLLSIKEASAIKVAEANAKEQRLSEFECLVNSQRSEIERLRSRSGVALPSLPQTGDGVAVEKPESDEVASLRREVQEFTRKQREWQESERDARLLLDAYKSLPKEKRQLAEVRSAELKTAEDFKQSNERCQQLKSEMMELRRKSGLDLRPQLKSQQDLNDALTKELDDVATEFDEMQEQNQRVLLQLKQIEDNNTTLVTERLKLQYAEERLRNELDVLVKKNENVSGQLQLYEQQERSLRAQISSVNDLLEKSHEETRLLQALAEEHKRTATECTEKLLRCESRLEAEKAELKAHVRLQEEKLQALEQTGKRADRLAEKLTFANKRLERLGAGASGDEEMETELKVLKSILKCSVCQDRQKNVVITKCFHCFCRHCIQENLKIRHRKCPGCGKSFGADDVHSIYLS